VLEKIIVKLRDIGNHSIDHGIGSGDERLLNQSDARIIKHPHAVMLVWRNNINRVHVSHPGDGDVDQCARLVAITATSPIAHSDHISRANQRIRPMTLTSSPLPL
jgi:hypothetical protein